MKKTLLTASIAAVFIISACSKPAETTQTNPTTVSQSAKAELGSFGVELDARDESVKPGDDFFQYGGGHVVQKF